MSPNTDGRLGTCGGVVDRGQPDDESRLRLLLRVPLAGGDLLFRTSGTWPREKALFAYPVGLHEWPDNPVIVERVPLRSCRRRGAAIDVIADRSRYNRSQLVFTQARGRDVVFWQSPRTRKQARPNVRTPTARAHGIEELQIVVDSHEQYAYRFATQQVTTVKRALPCGTTGSSSMVSSSPAWNASHWSIW
ncbi:putative eRCC4 domain protein [Mycobacteroides abscessus subsp. bolletii 103]|nr:putative eRCC4 domain protein [Mycobacteroides abscessus subsp. bolletii 103]